MWSLDASVAELKESTSRDRQEVDKVKAKYNERLDRFQSLENNARKNNIRLMNVLEGKEGEDIKALVVKLLIQSGTWAGPEDMLVKDIQRVHRDPYWRSLNKNKPRSILVNFLTYSIKEKILTKALLLSGKDCTFEVSADISHINRKKQWELGKRLGELKKLGGTSQLKFPATLKVMMNNKMYNLKI
ncbi:hypothetical protein NDU88_002955 [Pleurodeles waltl]|uniref:Uncharacterized protein n=1 Tax=Pleurodeles waltl TaxID=8319 RepID=A0AAV7T4V4_PLEWA|nr:hypothetical protein NDU88_002955 [Pleurodeles waltl]